MRYGFNNYLKSSFISLEIIEHQFVVLDIVRIGSDEHGDSFMLISNDESGILLYNEQFKQFDKFFLISCVMALS